jgi:hypothetical protein
MMPMLRTKRKAKPIDDNRALGYLSSIETSQLEKQLEK